ncbi:DUF11 domain-containing protein [Psychrobacter urativorans]|uniref:DUF11 domain-containing protein n=1 Tax=Psychrobacter urativorans TaxID=45610 RepID=A0A0M4TE40_9GAMM|nr:DUF11 domain-containing protein [Psychrobacter urativorans]ALF60532.1 hypothetical protein AOC03_11170 [Psychrobacter urativorans]
MVAGVPQTAVSNIVKVTVSETGSFTLDTDRTGTINPQAQSNVTFTHKLTNAGNVTDTYTIDIANIATGDDFDYDLTTSKITYKINSAGAAIDLPANKQITLEAGQYADIEIVAKKETSATKSRIDDIGKLTVSAASAYLRAQSTNTTPEKYTAVNTDTATTATPIYAINKSASTNLGLNNRNLDLNNSGAFVDYTITVKNEGNATGSEVTVVDELPSGLVAILSPDANYKAPTTKSSITGSKAAPIITAAGKTITVSGLDIAANEVITITFRAKKAEGADKSSEFNNYATVKDSTNNDATFDLIDHSDDQAHGALTENNYETVKAGSLFKDKGKDDNTAANVTASNQSRKIDLTGGDNKEVGLASESYYSYTITNNGIDLTEAKTAGEVYFTVAPTVDNLKVAIEKVYVDVDGNGVFSGGDVELTKVGGTENYDLHDVLVALGKTGLAPAPTEAVKILVKVNTTGADNATPTASDLGKSETMKVVVTAQGALQGTAAPIAGEKSTTITMQGIKLEKYQYANTCGTALTTIAPASWVKTDITDSSIAKPGNCIYYKLVATNTFTGTDLNTIAIRDEIPAKVTYTSGAESETSKGSLGASINFTSPNLVGTFATLKGQEAGTLLFSTKISQAGTK